jgi:hypothetical protein
VLSHDEIDARRCLLIALVQHTHHGGWRGILAFLRSRGDDVAAGDVAQAEILRAQVEGRPRAPCRHSSTISALNSGVNERRCRGFFPMLSMIGYPSGTNP